MQVGAATGPVNATDNPGHAQWVLMLCTADSQLAVLNLNTLEPLQQDAWLQPKNSSGVLSIELLDGAL